jgi:hypothetical protein
VLARFAIDSPEQQRFRFACILYINIMYSQLDASISDACNDIFVDSMVGCLRTVIMIYRPLSFALRYELRCQSSQ